MTDHTTPHTAGLAITETEAQAIATAAGRLIRDNNGDQLNPVTCGAAMATLYRENLHTPDHWRFLILTFTAITVHAIEPACTCGGTRCGGAVQVVFKEGDDYDTADVLDANDVGEPARSAGRLVGAYLSSDPDTCGAILRAVPDHALKDLLWCLFSIAIRATRTGS